MTHEAHATGREDRPYLSTVHDLLGKISVHAERIAVRICVILVALDLAVVLLEVVSRSLGSVVSWTEELARWLLIAMGFIGASVALKRGLHVGILFVVQKLPRGVKRVSILLGNLFILVFLGYFVWYSWLASLDAWRTTGDIIIIRLFWVKALLPFGGILMIVHTLYYVARTLRCEDPEEGLISQPEYEQALEAERQRHEGA